MIFQAIVSGLILMFTSTYAYSTDNLPTIHDPNSEIKTATANRAVESIIIETYQEVLKSNDYTQIQLTNAPISGKTKKRGRHLLSFAAFNGFPDLVKWGLDHGADINLGDKDAANMLYMSLVNKNKTMAHLALTNNANPNILMGNANHTMFGILIGWRLPVDFFFLAKEFKALPKDEEERQKILNHTLVSFDDHLITPSDNQFQELTDYIENAVLIEKPIPTAGKGNLITLDIVDTIDKQIITAIESGQLSEETLVNFKSEGKSFESFLAFNGFNNSLKKRLESMDALKARELIEKKDTSGNDLLISAIKSSNAEAVETVLKINSGTINSTISNQPNHYNPGKRPLHIAILWNVDYSIFKLLIIYGANPDLKSSTGYSAFDYLNFYRNNIDSEPGKYNKIQMLFVASKLRSFFPPYNLNH